MTSYRLTIRPLAPWASPWHADTLFGALCWKRRLALGIPALVEWLDAFRAGCPPFVLSGAFPSGLLPAPFGLRYKVGDRKVTRPHWLTEADFRALTSGQLPSGAIELAPQLTWTDATRLMVSLGRDTDRAEFGGALFEQDAESCAASDGLLDIYFRAADPKPLLDAFQLLALSGFGKKSSSGFGAFELQGEPAPCPWLDDFSSAAGFVSLSHFVPAPGDPVSGAWRTHVKYPKFHGNSVSHPWKGRLLTLLPGSAFRAAGPVLPHYGSMIELPVDDMAVLHYGLAFAAPCCDGAIAPSED